MTTAEREAQRESARTRANEVRSHLAEIRRELRGMSYIQGCRHAAVLLDQEDGHIIGSVKLALLLGAIKQMGVRRTRMLLLSAGIPSAEMKVRDLSRRQRDALAEDLRHRADYREFQLEYRGLS